MTGNSFPVATGEECRSRVVHVADVPPVPLMPGVITRIVSGQNLTLSVPEIDPNLAATTHSHPHEQMIVVLEGQFEVILEGKKYPMVAGDVIRIPPDVPHGGITGERTCRILEVFSPARRGSRGEAVEGRVHGLVDA